MPSLPVIAGVYLVTQRSDLVGTERHEFVNVLGIRDTTGAATPSQIATKVAAQWAAHIMPVLSAGFTMGNTDVLALDGTTATQSFSTASAGTAGGHATGNGMPQAIAFVMAWQTGLRGKQHRGRSYLVGLSSDQLVSTELSGLSSGEVAGVTAAGNAFIAGLPGGGAPALDLVVVSRKYGIATNVVNARCDSAVGIQRRRYEKVARH